MMKDLQKALEDLERITSAVLEFRKATAFMEENEPEKWPQRQDQTWVDANGDTFDPAKHAMNRETKIPTVNPDGVFRKRRAKPIIPQPAPSK